MKLMWESNDPLEIHLYIKIIIFLNLESRGLSHQKLKPFRTIFRKNRLRSTYLRYLILNSTS
ncbi:hypothetical protein HARCEL1_08560 [Halococcoides cellulosivorans]|uniref:Uncharacterized protein n=1 Tax=Halococcoides cellulosivorans TaxID=1679096 RepID=A0A2R4X1V7_9EURY|nr:hypothetical protein HARCEL1_08560 [Halococcoides cellulosivorans]